MQFISPRRERGTPSFFLSLAFRPALGIFQAELPATPQLLRQSVRQLERFPPPRDPFRPRRPRPPRGEPDRPGFFVRESMFTVTI